MDLYRGLPLPPSPCPTALAIGNFDGVHRGHQALIDALKAHAQPRNLACAVMTFEPHPREYFAARAGKPENAPLRVSTLRDRLEALAQHGVSITFLLRFADALAGMSAEDFVHKLLVNTCRARFVMVGEDFRFGAKRTGDVALLKAMGAQFGFTVATLSDVKEDGQRISSTMVRTALAQGNLSQTAELLGRPYSISGRVIHGAKLGRTLNFPTLNLRVPFMNPAARGVFAVQVHGLGAKPIPGVASLGLRPTVDETTQRKQGGWLLETFLFDWAGDAYGKLVRVELVKKLRDEEKFSDMDTLKHAMNQDAAQARAALGLSLVHASGSASDSIARISTSSVSA
jgi:riboflavin kinase / FMN adenylyltransferase